jgi:hypothetical protein
MNNPCGEISLGPSQPCALSAPVPRKQKFDPKRRWAYRERRIRIPFDRIKLPLIQRVYPQLIADNLVAVQPLFKPTGLEYYLKHSLMIDNPSPQFYDISHVYKPYIPASVNLYATS